MNKLRKINIDVFGVVFLLFSILFFIGCAVCINIYQKEKSYYITTRATISEIYEYQVEEESSDGFGTTYSTEHEVYVDYKVDGVLYEHVLYNSYNISMEIGDTLEIVYDSRNPSHISSPQSQMIPMIVFGIGGVCFLGASIYNFLKPVREKEDLSE